MNFTELEVWEQTAWKTTYAFICNAYMYLHSLKTQVIGTWGLNYVSFLQEHINKYH